MNFNIAVVNYITNASVVIKSTIGGIIIFYLLGQIPGAYGVLSITPTLLLPPNFRVWTLLTGIFIEKSIASVLLDIPILLLCGVQLEPLWGAMELLKFIAITGIGTTLLTSLVSLIAYAITRNYSLWFVQFSGIAGVIGGISVAFKQIIPDQKINLKIHTIRVCDIPFLSILIFIFLSVIQLLTYTQPVMIACGIIIGWVYLRFYQSHGKGIRGDMRENFEVATLFPPFSRPMIRLFSVAVYQCLIRIGWCQHPVRTYDVGAPSAITISLPGSDPADAERRRKKALRALNERLNQMQQKSSISDENNEAIWPTIEDELNSSKGNEKAVDDEKKANECKSENRSESPVDIN